MANWKDISATEDVWIYKGYNYKNKLYIVLQYDADKVSPTEALVRFALRRDTNYNYYDGFCILFNPTSDSRTLNVMKPATPTNNSVAWKDYYSTPFTVSKKYSDEYFPLPDFWYVNTGRRGTSIQQAAIDGDADELYSYVKDNGVMGGYKTKFTESAWEIDPSNTKANPGANPTLTLVDKKNNTVTISASASIGGTLNPREEAKLYYTTDGSDPKNSNTRIEVSFKDNETDHTETVEITKKCTVKAYIKCKFKYNITSAEGSVDAIYYAAPKWPAGAKVKLSASSFKNNRLTVKQDWGWEWTLANAANIDSPVKGYRVRFFVKRKNGDSFGDSFEDSFVNTKIIDYYDKKTARSYELTSGSGDWVYDRTSTNYPMPMAAADFENDIKPGDLIKLSVQAYSVNGATPTPDTPDKPDKLLSSKIESEEYTVQNAGIVNVKVGGQWKEGQVWVKTNNEWHEAETVNVKVDGSWKESQ